MLGLLLTIAAPARGAGLREEAVSYRAEGYQLQQRGDYAGAITSYQKAAHLDPTSAVLQNDLGIAFEGQGQWDRAEQAYLQALNMDPEHLQAYSNLALLFEKKNEREKAVYYWLQRAKRGRSDDAWTIRARERLAALGAVSGSDEADAFVQEERLRASRVIEETYNEAKAALTAGRYAEAISGFEETVALEGVAHAPLYTPLATRFITEARQALSVAESDQLGQASQEQRRRIDEVYAQAKAAFEASRFAEAIAGFERVTELEEQFHQGTYTPFAKDFIAQATRFLARAESTAMTGTRRAARRTRSTGLR